MTRSGMRLTAAAICGGLIATGLAIVPAMGHTQRFKSKVTISHPKKDRWEGRVKSDKKACQKNRLVTLYYDKAKPFKLDTDKTDAQGRWEMEVAIGDYYYATVKRSERGGANHDHICKGDRSPTIP